MALLSVIRRWHFREHLSIREICRRTGLSRNTIRKYLRSDAVEPAFKVPDRPSKLDPFADRLSGWLKKPGGDREMVDILALVLQHDEDAVLLAVEMALETGVPTKTHVLNLLHRLVDGKSITPPTLDAPQALMLVNEPEANVERYDALRRVRHAS